jgi:hypothetical protein
MKMTNKHEKNNISSHRHTYTNRLSCGLPTVHSHSCAVVPPRVGISPARRFGQGTHCTASRCLWPQRNTDRGHRLRRFYTAWFGNADCSRYGNAHGFVTLASRRVRLARTPAARHWRGFGSASRRRCTGAWHPAALPLHSKQGAILSTARVVGC